MQDEEGGQHGGKRPPAIPRSNKETEPSGQLLVEQFLFKTLHFIDFVGSPGHASKMWFVDL